MPNVVYVAEPLVDRQEPVTSHLELERPQAHDIVGPYGALTATMAPSWLEPAPSWAAWQLATPPRPQGPLERTLDGLATVPFAIWKRVALYSFLFMLFGNCLRCRGLSTFTNVGCAALLVLGVLGTVVSAQRNP